MADNPQCPGEQERQRGGGAVRDLLQRLDRQERIALGNVLDSAASRMACAAAGTLADYRERYLLRHFGPMIAETAELAELLRGLPPCRG